VKFLKHGLTAVIGLSLLELGIPISFSALSKHKLLIACGLLLFSAPWDLLLHNPAKEVVQTASPLASVAMVFMPSAKMIVEPSTSDDFGRSFVEKCKADFKLAELIPEKALSNSLSRCFIAKPSIRNIAKNMVTKNWSKLI
jgi:hypothetical protein